MGARPSRVLGALVGVALAAGACSTGERPSLEAVAVRVATTASGSDTPSVPDDQDLAAIVGLEVELYDTPDLDGAPTTAATPLAGTDDGGSTRTASVLDRRDGVVEVVTANGARGWMPDSALELVAVDTRITVDVSDQTLTVTSDGDETTTDVVLGPDIDALVDEPVFVALLLSLPDEPVTPWGSLLFVLSGSDVQPANLLAGTAVRGIFATTGGQMPSAGIGMAATDFADLANSGVALGTIVAVRA